MPTPIIPPLARVYNGSINPTPIFHTKPPAEGPRSVSLNINWVLDGGPNFSVSVNVASQQVLSLSKIQSLYVDNTSCGSIVYIYFSDTQQRILIPARSAQYVNVTTNLLQFVVWAPNAVVAADYTIVNVINEPAILSTNNINIVFPNTVSTKTGIATTGTHTFAQVIGASLLITDAQINWYGTLGANGSLVLELTDQNANALWQGTWTDNGNGAFETYVVMIEAHGAAIASNLGLSFVAISSVVNPNIFVSWNISYLET